MLGLVFFNMDLNFAGIQNRLGLIFFSLLIVAFASMSTIGVRLCWHGGGGEKGRSDVLSGCGIPTVRATPIRVRWRRPCGPTVYGARV